MDEAFIKLYACSKYLYPYLYIYLFYTYLYFPVLTDLFVFFSYYSFIFDYVVYSYFLIITDIVVFFSRCTFIVSHADTYTYYSLSRCRLRRREPSHEVAVRR